MVAQLSWTSPAFRAVLHPERLDMVDTVDTEDQPITLTISRVSPDLYHQYIAYGVTAEAQLYMFTGMDPVAHWVAASLLTIDDVSVLPLVTRLDYYAKQHAERQG